MNKRIEIYSILAGLVFLVSGTAKSLDTAFFASVIADYGFRCLQFLAPIIALLEILLGLLLIFQIRSKWSAVASITVTVFFTSVYFYALIFHDIKDCGCFGKITALNTSPAIVVGRNIIILYLLATIWYKGDNKPNYSISAFAVTLGFVCIAAFMSGYTYKYEKPVKTIKEKTVLNSKLNDFINTSADSTYIVFAFSYTCPHCLNSIANLKEYAASGIADKVLGIALGNTDKSLWFKEKFKPNFSIKNYSTDLFRLTKSFPKTYYIKNNTITMELSGELPCVYIFKDMLGKKPDIIED